MLNTVIDIQALTKRFPNETVALDNLSVKIKNHGITGLVGPDGAGKTTLIRLIAGLLKPTTGTITLPKHSDNDNVIGYMPQKFGLYEDLTVQENLTLYARLWQIPPEQRKNLFARMLKFTDLGPFTQRRAGKLSGGMKQKLGLACSLLGRPQILLLDEPSVGVDPIARRELWQMVKELTHDGLTVIWATSYLDEAENCQEVLLLNEGKLLFNGKPGDLTQRIQNRIFLLPAPAQGRRQLLADLLQRSEIKDGVIQGENLRLLLNNVPSSSKEHNFVPTRGRFEDAFIDILEGNYLRSSALAAHIQPKTITKANPIQASHLTKHFGNFVATDNISFNIKQGEIFGLLGPNGAGKSTLFKMLCGLLQPTAGSALVSGFDLKTSPSHARARIGYMAQKFSLYGDLSVKQNLEFFARIYGLTGNQRQQQIEQMIQIFDLHRYLTVNTSTLPLGFKQRLALACAVMHEPDVLFLDEPTSGVDPLTRREFWVHINGMVQKGVTIMITTHFMDEAEYCDQIALIYRGKNIATGSPDELKARVRSLQHPEPTLEDAFIELISHSEQLPQEQ